jgi:hypothetical protein
MMNKIELWEFAIRRIKQCNDELAMCHTNGLSGDIDDEDVQQEVNETNAWLEQARKELRLMKEIDRLVARARVTVTLKTTTRNIRRRGKK